MGGGEVEAAAAAVHGGGVRELITTTTVQRNHPVARLLLDRPRLVALLVSCWRPGLVPCADWGVFDEVRVRYAGVHTPETVARSLSSTHTPRYACCCHSPMYIPLLEACIKKICHHLYDGSDYTMLLDARWQALMLAYQQPSIAIPLINTHASAQPRAVNLGATEIEGSRH